MQEEEAIAAVAQLLQYVRLFGINPKTRQRNSALLVHHPDALQSAQSW